MASPSLKEMPSSLPLRHKKYSPPRHPVCAYNQGIDCKPASALGKQQNDGASVKNTGFEDRRPYFQQCTRWIVTINVGLFPGFGVVAAALLFAKPDRRLSCAPPIRLCAEDAQLQCLQLHRAVLKGSKT